MENTYTYKVSVCGNTTVDDLSDLLEFLRGIATANFCVDTNSIDVEQIVVADPSSCDGLSGFGQSNALDKAFVLGYSVALTQSEVEDFLESYNATYTPWMLDN